MGYTPLFSSLTNGTLCGRWPDIGLWPIVLSMADKHGMVDVTPRYIANVTGLAEPEVVQCMARFCEPDPFSRSSVANGARLVLLDSHREWGWQVVNFDAYREKARKAAWNAAQVESGQNAERLRAKREATRADPTRPDVTGDDQMRPARIGSQTQTKTQTYERTEAGNGALHPNLNVSAWDQWEVYKRKQFGMSYKSPKSKALAQKRLAELGTADYQQQCVDHSMALTWRGIFEPHQYPAGKAESFMQTQARILAEGDDSGD